MKEHRVIPYTETLTWVREDAVVAVSHLKQGASWEPATAEHQNAEPNSNSIPETQTNLITIYFNREGKLAYRILTITTTAHSKAINAVTAVMKEDHSMSYITGGRGSEIYHWKFHAPDGQGDRTYDPQGLDAVHHLHSNAVTSVAYSYYSKTLFSGGLDKKYISYDLEHDKAIHEQRLGPVTHILQNPTDPRINVVSLLRKSHQYVLMDERAPTLPVLTLGYPTTNVISRLSAPSWQPEGGLLCTGASEDGVVNVWDVRWNGIRLNYNQRPGAGVVTGDVHFDSIVTTGCGASGHPIFRNRPPLYGDTSSRTAGGPSQILNLGGKRIVHACFHPVKNVMMILNKDGSMAFMNYNMRRDPII
ncbi:WD40-repeat-containing domain protein [Dissophora ornata]|nr:WD40-repeat-containing domain protein [Dissophora ornata]